MVSLRSKLGLLFVSFLSLVTISVAVTAWVIDDQQADALVINLAGRQRMLIQQITREALLSERQPDGVAHLPVMREAAGRFDRTLHALLDGGPAPYLPGEQVTLPAADEATIRRELGAIADAWAVFAGHLATIESASAGSPARQTALDAVERLAPELAERTDRVVRLYEDESTRKIARLRWIQAGFFAGAVALLAAGLVTVRRSVILPLGALARAARRIGQGNLDDPVAVRGPRELAALAQSFEAMRGQLKAGHDDLELRVRQRTRELTALYDVIREISARLEIDHVLHSVTAKARDLIDSDVAFLCLLDDEGRSLSLKSHEGPPDAVCGTCVLARRSVAGRVLDHGGALICDVPGCRNIAPHYRASHMAAPLHAGDRVIGALCVGSARRAQYSADQARLLTELANSTAIALDNARLYEQAERLAALEERQRIAAEMHDGLAQTLSYLQIKTGQVADLLAQDALAEVAPHLDQIAAALDRAGLDVRRSIASLQAEIELPQALQGRLGDLVAELAAVGGPPADLIAPDQPVVVPPDEASQVLRITQEALHNARRHAGAARITVRLDRDGTRHRITVRDDGCGFDPAEAALNGKGHFGLSIMRARASRLGGDLAIRTAPGAGTEVILTWPAGPE